MKDEYFASYWTEAGQVHARDVMNRVVSMPSAIFFLLLLIFLSV